ncbi:MAG: DUF4493 domain-containing protein [Bacteroidales bacterium]
MKNRLFIPLLLTLTMTTFTSCERESFSYEQEQPGDDTRAEGQISLSGLKLDVQLGNTRLNTKSTVDLSQYIIRVFDKDNANKLVKEWSYAELPELFSLKVGNYSIAAYSHDQLPAEFERPFYYGVKEFEVKADELTSIITIKCVLRSIMVSVIYDDELMELLEQDVNSTVKIGEGELIFHKDDNRAGHFLALNENQNVLNTLLKGTIDGEMIEYAMPIPNVKAGEHRIIRYSIKDFGTAQPEEGNGSFSITIDMSTTVVDQDGVIKPGEELIPDDKPNPDPDPTPNENIPTVVGQGFDITQPILVPQGGLEVIVNIAAPKGISNLLVEIDSNTLTEDILLAVGLAKSFDLANPGELQEGLSSLGFPTGDQVVGQKELLFDITQFTPLLGIYGAGTHNFKITVIDQESTPNRKDQTLTLITQ